MYFNRSSTGKFFPNYCTFETKFINFTDFTDFPLGTNQVANSVYCSNLGLKA